MPKTLNHGRTIAGRYVDPATGDEMLKNIALNADGTLRSPPILQMSTADTPITPGGSQSGFVSGVISDQTGGSAQGSGLTFTFTIDGSNRLVPAISNGGSGYLATTNFDITIPDGTYTTQWTGYVTTDSSGVVTAIASTNANAAGAAGGAYTVAATTVTVPTSAVVNSIFDLGPNWDQYNVGMIMLAGLPTPPGSNTVQTLSTYLAADSAGVSVIGMTANAMGSNNNELYISPVGGGSPARLLMLGSRYIKVYFRPGRSTVANTKLSLVAYPHF